MTDSTPDQDRAGHDRDVDDEGLLPETGPRVLCLTPTDPPTEATLRRALAIAGNQGAVVLFDRSSESWRPDEDAVLVAADDERFVEVDEIHRAREIAESAAADVVVWRSITPALGTGLMQVVQAAEISDIVVPADGHQDATGDRFMGSSGIFPVGGSGSFAEAVEALLEKPVVADTGFAPELHVVTPSGS
ncbi:MAG: hypothetical protein R2707_11105 [Acidimicrobiales bacterium]